MTGQVSAVESLAAVVNRIEPLDSSAMDAAAAGLDRLTKPPGSLGRLEELVIALAGITGRADAAVARRAVVVTAGGRRGDQRPRGRRRCGRARRRCRRGPADPPNSA